MKSRRINKILLFTTILSISFSIWSLNVGDERFNNLIDENLIMSDQIKALEDHIVTLQKQIEDQNESIERLMKLETVSMVKQVTMAEARGSSLKDQCAVMQTMLDRTTWGITVQEAINKKNQYAKPYIGEEPSESVNMAFDLVFVQGYRVFPEITTHFYNQEMISAPYWADTKASRGIIRSHKYMGDSL